jgi:sugar transferase (PEP-CTERM/EpsH1 system associated)
MNLLFLAHRIPYPPNKGDKIRSHALLRHLAARHRVFLGCFVDEDADFQYRGEVEAMTAGCRLIALPKTVKHLRSAGALLTGASITEAVYRSRPMRAWVDQVLKNEAIDAALVFSSAMAPYLMARDIARATLFDMVDLDSDKWRQYSRSAPPLLAQLYRREADKLLALERAAASSFALTYLVSPYEADSFCQLAPSTRDRVRALSNGVDLDRFHGGKFASPFPAGVTPIVMTGRMDYWPNEEGAAWFARSVMPAVKQSIPNARFFVVGAQPSKSLLALNGPDVAIVGEVPDIRAYIANASAVVAPLRIARGVQNKVLEALAMGVPTVATGDASRALKVRAGHDLYVENEPEEFAAAVVAAAQGSTRDKIAANGRAYVEQNHQWARLFAALDADLESVRRPLAMDGYTKTGDRVLNP